MERCKCPTQFPMIRVSEGKYRIGDTKVLIFVRVSNYYFDKFDCRKNKCQFNNNYAFTIY